VIEASATRISRPEALLCARIQPPGTGKLKVFMTDFGMCLLRGQAKSDKEFNAWQAEEDEEGAIGLVMQSNLKGGFKYSEIAQRV
jgi:hypothetical protein